MPYYSNIRDGIKNFEVRFNDRDYHINDVIVLQEYNQNKEQYTGCQCEYRITYILYGGSFGLENGYVVMSLIPISDGERINLMQVGALNHITYGKN